MVVKTCVGQDMFVPIFSTDWFKGTEKSHISWENLWFPVKFPLSQPIDFFVLRTGWEDEGG